MIVGARARPQDPILCGAPQCLLSIRGVSKNFPGVKALQNIAFDVNAGEVHALVGENGAGKSTLMAIASGALRADSGSVAIAGQTMDGDPELARELGLAIVRQEPSLMPDLTVAENLYLGLPAARRPRVVHIEAWANRFLRQWSDDLTFNAGDRVVLLNPEQRFTVEIVKALACEPKVLVLDEPTEHLLGDDVKRLFKRIRQVAARGACVVYISHRIREVQLIADRLSVLRDGQGQGTFPASDLSADQIVTLIVGNAIDREFPAKTAHSSTDNALEVSDFAGRGFNNINLSVRRGEILGLAGIDGNGQCEFMRGLAGLAHSRGIVSINGARISVASPHAAAKSGIHYLPGDRHREGIFADQSACENFSLRSLSVDAVMGVIGFGSQRKRAAAAIRQFAVRTPSIETPVRALSGGNQQKLVLASVLASKPDVILVDEPTQGVDVGARAEIYKILREYAARGSAIIVLSSDAQEVAGLSDRVLVFSRGRIVESLAGEQVTENNITSAFLKSTSVRDHARHSVGAFWRWASGNAAPLAMVAAAILLMGAVAGVANPFYLTPRSLGGMMTLAATLAFVAYGEQILMLVGGIDLSVGALMGLVQVVASFYLVADASAGQQAFGIGLIICVSLAVGVANWTLVDLLELHPMIGTLATFMALQAISLLLRPMPGGMFDDQVMSLISIKLGYIPATMIVALILGLSLELLLFKSELGVSFRGFGSRPEAARVAGVKPRRTRLIAYVGCSLMSGLAAITLMQQIGIGDPRAGLGYTLTSIAAAAIGGASLFGARGSFLGALLGSAFITQVNAVTSFLALDQAWQSYLLGAMIIAAVALYSKSRQMAAA